MGADVQQARPPKGQVKCWCYLCENGPEVSVALPRRPPARRPLVAWVCRSCAGRIFTHLLKSADAPSR